MTDGQKLFNALAAARMVNDGKLTEEKWVSEADSFMDRERPRPKKKKVNVLGAGLTDLEWHKVLESNPDLDGIDVPEQHRKCRVHFSSRGIVPSRARVLKWLANADRTLPMGQRKATVYNDVYKEPPPDLWRQTAKRIYPGTTVGEAFWLDLGTDYRARILKELNR